MEAGKYSESQRACQFSMEPLVVPRSNEPDLALEIPKRTRPCCHTTRKRQNANAAAPVAKRVRFHVSAKTHDGIALEQAIFERVVLSFFSKSCELTTLLRLLNKGSHGILRTLLIYLLDTIRRLTHSSQGRVPLLARGGGRGHFIKRQNLRHLRKLLKITALTYQECKREIAAKTAQKS